TEKARTPRQEALGPRAEWCGRRPGARQVVRPRSVRATVAPTPPDGVVRSGVPTMPGQGVHAGARPGGLPWGQSGWGIDCCPDLGKPGVSWSGEQRDGHGLVTGELGEITHA